MKLDGAEFEEFKNALQDAYPSRSDLEQMLRYRLNRSLSVIGSNLGEIIFRLIQEAEAEGWTEQLVVEAYNYNPDNELLRQFYQKYLSKRGIAIPFTAIKHEKHKAQVSQRVAKGKPRRRKHTSPKIPQNSPQDKQSTSAASSPPDFLEQAHTYLSQGHQCVQNASMLFKYNIIPFHYKIAIELLEQTREQLKNLYELVDTTSPFPKITGLNKPQSISKQQFISKIEYILEKIEDEVIPSLEDATPQHQDIQEKLETLAQSLREFYPLKILQTLAETMNPGDNTFKPPPDQTLSFLTLLLRTQLIEALLVLPASNSLAGRSAFLAGIPGTGSMNRDPGNAQLDLDLIIDQLDKLGRLSSGEWPLLLLTDNALHYARGFKRPEETLKRIRQELAKGCQEI